MYSIVNTNLKLPRFDKVIKKKVLENEMLKECSQCERISKRSEKNAINYLIF